MDYHLTKRATLPSVGALNDLRWLFANLGIDPRYREWFQHRAWVRTIHGTTRIEGNSLNDLEVEELLEPTDHAAKRCARGARDAKCSFVRRRARARPETPDRRAGHS